MCIVEYCIVCRNRFVENLLEFAGKCIYRNETMPVCRDKVVQSDVVSGFERIEGGEKRWREAVREDRQSVNSQEWRH